MNTDRPVTRRLRGFAVATNLGAATAGLTLAGWLPNLTGMALAGFGSLFLGFAQLQLAASNAFLLGSRDPEHVSIWNSVSLVALASIAAIVYYGWTHIGTAGKTVLILLILASILVRIHPGLRDAPAAVDARHDGGGRRGV